MIPQWEDHRFSGILMVIGQRMGFQWDGAKLEFHGIFTGNHRVSIGKQSFLGFQWDFVRKG